MRRLAHCAWDFVPALRSRVGQALCVGIAFGLVACERQPPMASVPEVDTSQMESVVAVAVEAARVGVSARSDAAASWGELGMVCHVHGLRAAAIEAYRQARALDSEDVRWPYFLAEVLALEGSVEEAAEQLREARRLRPDYAPIVLRLGDLLLAQGDLAGAERSYRRALSLDEDLGPAVLGLGQALLQSEDVAAAVEPLERAARLLPKSGTARFSLSQAYQRLGRVEEAERLGEAAASSTGVDFFQDPLMFEVIEKGVSSALLRDRARSLASAGEHRQAVALYLTLLARDSAVADVHQELAVSHQALGEVAPAVARLRRVLELAPERTPVAIRLAILLLESGDAAGALVQLERARRDLPQDVELAAMTGRALLLLDDPAGAVAAFETAARLGAVDPWVRNEWGNALARLGRYREAEAQLRAVLESDGSNAQALYQLGLTLEVQGRRDEAKRLYEQAMALGANPLVAARLDALSG